MAIHIPYKNQMKIYFNLNIALEVKVVENDDKIRWYSNQNEKEFLLRRNHVVIY